MPKSHLPARLFGGVGAPQVWSGLEKELLTDADTFMSEFPKGADMKMKTTLLGATFLLNQLYFE